MRHGAMNESRSRRLVGARRVSQWDADPAKAPMYLIAAAGNVTAEDVDYCRGTPQWERDRGAAEEMSRAYG